jgi:hypothetical protein
MTSPGFAKPHWSEQRVFLSSPRQESVYRHHMRSVLSSDKLHTPFLTPPNIAVHAPASYSTELASHLLPDGPSVSAARERRRHNNTALGLDVPPLMLIQQQFDLSPAALRDAQAAQERRQLSAVGSPEEKLSSAFTATRLFAQRAPHEYFILNNSNSSSGAASPTVALNLTPRNGAAQRQQQLTDSRFSPDNPHARELERLRNEQRVREQDRADRAYHERESVRQLVAQGSSMSSSSHGQSHYPPVAAAARNPSTASSAAIETALYAGIAKDADALERPIMLRPQGGGAFKHHETGLTIEEQETLERAEQTQLAATIEDFRERHESFVSSPHNRDFFRYIGESRLASSIGSPVLYDSAQMRVKALSVGLRNFSSAVEKLAMDYHVVKQSELLASFEAVRQMMLRGGSPSPRKLRRAD